MLSVTFFIVMLSVVMLNVIMVSVVAPNQVRCRAKLSEGIKDNLIEGMLAEIGVK